MTEPRDGVTSAALAYLGDSVIEVLARERLVLEGIPDSARLNVAAAKYVRATAQSAAAERVMPLLSEREAAVYRRARNAKKTTRAKHATAGEYSMSTGFEAVIGYLYLTGNRERLEALLRGAFPAGEL